jgi:ABC-type antimicrobial peptide transport system permease subunit
MFSILITAFACLAILFTAVGLYGVLAYSIAHRTPEIGLRIALGATPARVRASVFRQVGIMTLVGCAAGLALAAGLIRSMQSLGFFIKPMDWILLFFADQRHSLR